MKKLFIVMVLLCLFCTSDLLAQGGIKIASTKDIPNDNVGNSKYVLIYQGEELKIKPKDINKLLKPSLVRDSTMIKNMGISQFNSADAHILIVNPDGDHMLVKYDDINDESDKIEKFLAENGDDDIANTSFTALEIKHLKTDIKSDKDSLKALKLKFKNEIDVSQREIIKNEFDEIEQGIDNKLLQLDSMKIDLEEDIFRSGKAQLFSFGTTKSRAFFDFIYSNQSSRFKALNHTSITIGSSTGTLYSELAAGYLGPFRMSLGALLAKSSATDSLANRQEAIQRLRTNGGNTILEIEYPLFYDSTPKGVATVFSRLSLKGTADFPQLGTTTDSFAGSGILGFDLYGQAKVNNNSIQIFAHIHADAIYGTDEFKENLSIEHNALIFGQITVGVIIAENLKFSFSILSFSTEPSLRRSKVVAGGEIVH